MEKEKNNNLNIAALILMGFLLLNAGSQLLMYYQYSNFFAPSPFISEALGEKFKQASFIGSMVCAAALVPAGLFYLLKKPVFTIVIALLAIGFVQFNAPTKEVLVSYKEFFSRINF